MAIPTAVIGYGNAGRTFHCYLIGLTPALEIVGVASRSDEKQQAIKADLGCKAYATPEEVFADDSVQLVVLATPNHTHAELAIKAMEAGKHVVTDKPMALNAAEADAMLDAAKRTGQTLSVFQNRRWDGDFLTVKKLLNDGRLGNIRRLEMAWGGFGMWGGWRGQAQAGGGKLYDLGVHLADQVCQLMPQRITRVYSQLQFDSPAHDVESDAKVMVHFEDDATAVLTTSSIMGVQQPRFYVAGSEATFCKFGLDPQEAAMKAGDIDSAVNTPESFGQLSNGKTTETIPTETGRWRNFYENIAAHLKDEADLAVRPETVRRGIALIEAAFESHKQGRAIDLDL